MICADNSFLISLYGDDVNSERARALMAQAATLEIHEINDFEFANALRLLVFRGKISPEQRRNWQAAYDADKISGVLVKRWTDMSAIFEKATTLSTSHTETLGNRAYDILQVAAAKLLGATDFWSFDGKQRELAKAEGLQVRP
jgi:predicted nucleic acid-binding protein